MVQRRWFLIAAISDISSAKSINIYATILTDQTWLVIANRLCSCCPHKFSKIMCKWKLNIIALPWFQEKNSSINHKGYEGRYYLSFWCPQLQWCSFYSFVWISRPSLDRRLPALLLEFYGLCDTWPLTITSALYSAKKYPKFHLPGKAVGSLHANQDYVAPMSNGQWAMSKACRSSRSLCSPLRTMTAPWLTSYHHSSSLERYHHHHCDVVFVSLDVPAGPSHFYLQTIHKLYTKVRALF